MSHLKKAIESIRERIDEQEFGYMVCSAMRERVQFSYMYPREERLFTLTTRITSQEDFDNIITQIHNRYARR